MVQRVDPLYLSPLWASIEGTVKSEALRLGIPEQTQRAVSLGVPSTHQKLSWPYGSVAAIGRTGRNQGNAQKPLPMQLARHIRGTLLHETPSDRY